MNRKLAIIFIAASLVVVTLILISYLFLRTKFAAISPVAKVTSTPVVEELSTWTDPAQFSFQYPKSLSLNPHNEDQENYAHVELATADHPGNLIVWVKDTTTETIDDWIAQNKIKNAVDSQLAEIPAKKVLATDKNVKITLSAINYGYLYQIELNPTDNDFWNKIFNQVISSFKFIPTEQYTTKQSVQQSGPATSTDQGFDEGIYEEEEVIE